VLARQNDEETVVALNPPLRAVRVTVSPTSSAARRKLVNLDINAATSTRTCAVLKTRQQELLRSNFLGPDS